MSDLPLAYIAAPLNDASPTIVAWHVARARLLARLALACGYAPVVVHGEIEAGTYGDDSDPVQRARGMAATAAICRGVLATLGAVLWALLRDDGTAITGTAGERDIARKLGAERIELTWAEWRTVASAYPDLLPEWDRLAERPDAVGEWMTDDGCSWRWYANDDCAAMVLPEGWEAYALGGIRIASGPETGALGRAAADAALRAAGVIA